MYTSCFVSYVFQRSCVSKRFLQCCFDEWGLIHLIRFFIQLQQSFCFNSMYLLDDFVIDVHSTPVLPTIERIGMILPIIKVMLSIQNTLHITKTRKKGSNWVLGNTTFHLTSKSLLLLPLWTWYSSLILCIVLHL